VLIRPFFGNYILDFLISDNIPYVAGYLNRTPSIGGILRIYRDNNLLI